MARINHISAPRKADPTRYGFASLELGLAPYDSAALCRIALLNASRYPKSLEPPLEQQRWH